MQGGAKKMDENEISRHIVTAAIEAHKTLGGPGLLESVYEEALAYELHQLGLNTERQKTLPIIYKGIQLASLLKSISWWPIWSLWNARRAKTTIPYLRRKP